MEWNAFYAQFEMKVHFSCDSTEWWGKKIKIAALKDAGKV